VAFDTDDNFDAIKIESGDAAAAPPAGVDCGATPNDPGCLPSYSKVYKIDKKKNLSTQIKAFLEKDFLVTYNTNIGVLEEYRTKLKEAKGFNVYINDVVEGNKNLDIIKYDRSFHVETFTFDMKDYNFNKLEIRTQDYDAPTGTKWTAFIDAIKGDPAGAAVAIDKYQLDDVIPKLKCDSPCYNCFDSDPKFCTSCWGD
jgi:hypothetical protein